MVPSDSHTEEFTLAQDLPGIELSLKIAVSPRGAARVVCRRDPRGRRFCKREDDFPCAPIPVNDTDASPGS